MESSSGRTLEGNDLKAIASYIKSGKCRNVALMLGAGKLFPSLILQLHEQYTKASALLLAFPTSDHQEQANLARLKLPYPEAVFEIGFFQKNPVPFYTLAHELYPGKFRPTLTHSFIRLLSEHSLLSMCFTQNIDTLERRAGVPDEKIIEAHGSFASQRCIKCHTPFDDNKIKEMVLNFSKTKQVPRCDRKRCNGLVKPDIVFFGEALPRSFGQAPSIIRKADLLIVIGTSLTVHPFASLASIAPDDCPRVLINIDHVGDFGSRDDDVLLLGKCDEVIKDLCTELGWENELYGLWKKTAKSVDDSKSDEVDSSRGRGEEKLEKEVAQLAERLQTQMALEQTDSGTEEDKREETLTTKDELKLDDTSEGAKLDPLLSKAAPEPTPSEATSSAQEVIGQKPEPPLDQDAAPGVTPQKL